MRAALHKLRVRLGALDVFVPSLLKPEAQRWRAALIAVRAGQPMPALPRPGVALLGPEADRHGAALAFRRLGHNWLRVDLADRLAAFAHQARAGHKGNEAPLEPIDRDLVTSLGLSDETLAQLMAEVGFKADGGGAWHWRGNRPRARPRPVPARPGNAFAALAGLKR
jgi:ATP-dependent RNA helicase SUPV3L1/SUV3